MGNITKNDNLLDLLQIDEQLVDEQQVDENKLIVEIIKKAFESQKYLYLDFGDYCVSERLLGFIFSRIEKFDLIDIHVHFKWTNETYKCFAKFAVKMMNKMVKKNIYCSIFFRGNEQNCEYYYPVDMDDLLYGPINLERSYYVKGNFSKPIIFLCEL